VNRETQTADERGEMDPGRLIQYIHTYRPSRVENVIANIKLLWVVPYCYANVCK